MVPANSDWDILHDVRQPCDAPQADRLDLVRQVVEVVIDGVTDTQTVAARAQVAPRYALYCLHAARVLNLLETPEHEAPRATALGHQLAATAPGSDDEREVLRGALECSAAVGTLASLVLGESPPSVEKIADRLLDTGHVSVSTALRRARTLLCWRRYLLPQIQATQLSIRFDVSGKSGGVQMQAISVPGAGRVENDKDHVQKQIAGMSPRPLPDSIEPPPSQSPSDDPEPAKMRQASDDDSEAESECLSPNDLAYLRRHIEQGTVVLFTGAGFSAAAKDGQGHNLPVGAAYARELWEICYPGEQYDASSLQDIFEHAHRRHPKDLIRSLEMRFAADGPSLPDWYKAWFSFPWSRVYTVNVDDLELAADRRFGSTRTVRSISALTQTHGGGDGTDLDVIHLNGRAADGPDKVTFSVDQYSQRIARQEPFYAQLAAEIHVRPFVFVGSPLDEPLLWSHIGLRGLRGRDSENELRAKSFLVSPDLSRARRDKLRAYNVIWVKGTAETFAANVLSALADSAESGRRRIAVSKGMDGGDPVGIVEVTSAISRSAHRTRFLVGDEPTWSDLTDGRAVTRDEDKPRLENLLSRALASRKPSEPPVLLSLAATAGAGKTTFLMRAALHLCASGVRVAWVGASSDVAPSVITRYYRSDDRPRALIVDDAGRFGTELVPTLLNLAQGESPFLILLGLRSYHQHLLESPAAASLGIESDTIGPLTNDDIDRLLDVLDREKLLGVLRSLKLEQRRAAFRERASRQILVAMIETTSGERFEDKVIREWQCQEPVGQYVYALVALATANGYPLSKDEILLSCSGGPRELEALAKLKKGHLVVEEDGRCRARHRVIAEKLVDELAQRGTQLERLVVGLCRALAIKVDSNHDRSARPQRVLKRLLNHNTLLRLLADVEPARAVYGELEDHLNWDYHFWLQRGCLELEDGDVRYAENFLHQSAALNSDDPLVQTALAHMRLRRAISNPAAPEAGEAAEKAFGTLRDLIAVRGSRDPYPAHVFGSQALGWTRRATLTPRDRLALLREARDIVGQAVGLHRSRKELSQLEFDLRAALLQPI